MEIRRNGLVREGAEAKKIALHLLRRLKESPVLLAFLAVGTIVAVIESGFMGLAETAVNWLILGAFAVLIFRMTESRAVEAAPKRLP